MMLLRPIEIPNPSPSDTNCKVAWKTIFPSQVVWLANSMYLIKITGARGRLNCISDNGRRRASNVKIVEIGPRCVGIERPEDLWLPRSPKENALLWRQRLCAL
jgi:hypothetical protein